MKSSARAARAFSSLASRRAVMASRTLPAQIPQGAALTLHFRLASWRSPCKAPCLVAARQCVLPVYRLDPSSRTLAAATAAGRGPIGGRRYAVNAAQLVAHLCRTGPSKSSWEPVMASALWSRSRPDRSTCSGRSKYRSTWHVCGRPLGRCGSPGVGQPFASCVSTLPTSSRTASMTWLAQDFASDLPPSPGQ